MFCVAALAISQPAFAQSMLGDVVGRNGPAANQSIPHRGSGITAKATISLIPASPTIVLAFPMLVVWGTLLAIAFALVRFTQGRRRLQKGRGRPVIGTAI